MHDSCKIYKKCVNACLPFRQILSAFQTLINKLAKLLVPILLQLTSEKFKVNNSLNFATEIIEQIFTTFMGKLGIDWLFTIIPFKKTLKFVLVNFLKRKTLFMV